MKIKNDKVVSNRNSVKLLAGTFFDNDMKEIFTPLENKEVRLYLRLVDAEEEFLNKTLNHQELLVLYDDMIDQLAEEEL